MIKKVEIIKILLNEYRERYGKDKNDVVPIYSLGVYHGYEARDNETCEYTRIKMEIGPIEKSRIANGFKASCNGFSNEFLDGDYCPYCGCKVVVK